MMAKNSNENYQNFLDFLSWQELKTPNRFYNQTQSKFTVIGDPHRAEVVVSPGDFVEMTGGTFYIIKVETPVTEPHKCKPPLTISRRLSDTIWNCLGCGRI